MGKYTSEMQENASSSPGMVFKFSSMFYKKHNQSSIENMQRLQIYGRQRNLHK